MSLPFRMSQMRRVIFLASAVLLAAGFANAQSAPTQNQSPTTGDSSSQAGLSESGLQLAEFSLPDSAFPGSPSGSPQYGNGGGGNGGGKHGMNWAFEAGAGFNAPVGNDIPYISWGGNFTVGGGLRLSNRLSALLEYQFLDNKLPGALIAATGTSAGDAHINAITVSPVIYPFPKMSTGVYLVGGFGYYHESINFNDFVCCTFYGYDEELTVASITSNNWGANGGLGVYHRLGGARLFAEARYTFINTPPITQTNGFGTTELIPVTLGIRF